MRIVPALSRRTGVLLWVGSVALGAFLLVLTLPVMFDWKDPDALPDDHLAAVAGFVTLQIYAGITALILFAVFLWRGRLPVMLLTVFVSAVTVLGTVACLVSLWRVSRFARGQHAVGGGIAAGAGGVLSILLNPDGPDLELFVVLGLVIVTVVTVGRSRARHDASEREIESLRRERAIADDRLRLARDIHDSLSHRLSLIAIHSGAMDYRRDLSRDQSAESIGVIHRESQAAVSDLRDIILTLRTPHQDEGGAYSPYDVIEKARERGQAVNVSTGFPSDTALLAGLSTTALTALVATLRECLNNADRHAQGTRVAVEARLSAGWLTVTVINPLEVSSLSDVDAPLTGFGLRGVRERAELAEGRLVVEKAGGEFVVTISLPWKDSAE